MNVSMSHNDDTIRVRVRAGFSALEGVADSIICSLGQRDGLELVDRSRSYLCRPSEQEKARII